MIFAIDSSVLIAIVRQEAEAAHFAKALYDRECVIGWPTVLETRIVCIRHLGLRTDFLDGIVAFEKTRVVSFDLDLEAIAARAFAQFGKGIHPARLNYGDCMSYAVAVSRNLPLLFKGGDFGKTDVRVHPASVITEPANT